MRQIQANIVFITAGSTTESGFELNIGPDAEIIPKRLFYNDGYGKPKIKNINASNANNLKMIGELAFHSIGATGSLDFSNTTLETIESKAFQYNSLESVSFPETIKTIESYSFGSNETLTTLNLPENGLFEIKEYAFNNSQINNVNLKGCKSIGNGAFTNSKISKVEIENNCKFIGSEPFSNCPLSEIRINSEGLVARLCL